MKSQIFQTTVMDVAIGSVIRLVFDCTAFLGLTVFGRA